MFEPPSLDEILVGGLEALLNPAKRRRQAAQELPLMAIQRIKSGFADDERDAIVSEFIEKIWDVIEQERGDAQGMGWDDLMVGAAVALEILTGDGLPRRIERAMHSSSARDRWWTLRTTYQQFVLTIDHRVKLQRILKLEDGTTLIDGPQFQGKSHTLMEELLVRDLLQDLELPVAATGEFREQGGRILPVSNLVEKAIKWWTTKPGGIFISCVPTTEELEQILKQFPNRVDGKSIAQSPSPLFMTAMDSWIMGASIHEIERKLDTYRKKRTVRMWDGSEHETYLLPRTRFEVPEKENTTPYMVLEQVARKQHAAFRTQQTSTGLLLIGGPGCGKSIYSRVLESTSMIQGPLGQLGFGIRSTAKMLGRHLRASPKASWLEFFKATGEHDDAFLEALTGTNRLVPIIDGLDEVSPKELELIKSWLSQDKGIWIASSRPISRLDGFPNAKRVKLDELEQADATALFSLIGKPQFAKWWREQPHYKKTPIQTLGLTPLHLTMIAQAYDAPDALPSASDVYSRIFAGWLDRAVQEDRVDEDTQDQLRSLLPLFIGEIALHWLQAEEPYIERPLIDQQFEAAGISFHDRGPLLKALASVNLLLPDGDVYELGHRTFAEYAAACALRQRVSQDNTEESELEELSFALQDGLLHKSKWKTLLTFYAPYIQHPHALLKRFIGVASLRDPNIYFESTQSYEFGKLWAFAIELVSQGKRWSSNEACAAWSTALKLWLFARSHNAHFELGSLRPLGETLGRYLPKTLDGHIQLLGDERQQKQLRDVGLELLDAMPATIHEDIKNQLIGSDLDKDEAIKIMTWLKRLECAPTNNDLEVLLERWAEDSTVSGWVWALCLIKSPYLLDGRITKMLRQGDFSCSELIGLWLVAEVPPGSSSATKHYKIRRDAMDLLLEGDMPSNFHQHVGKLSQEALDEIIDCLWMNTPPHARNAIEDLLRNSKRIPTQCQVRDVISMYLNGKGVHESDGILSMMEWFKDHQDDLRTYLRDASGEHKYAVVVLLAHIDQEFETEALAKHLHEADEEYSKLAYERIRTLSDSDPEEPLPKSVDMSKMSLLVRATQEFGSWKLELFEALAKGATAELLQLVAKKKLRNALPILCSSLEGTSWRHESDLLPCIAALVSPKDTELGRAAMRYALSLAWTYESEEKRYRYSSDQVTRATLEPLESFLCLDDLELIVKQDKAVEIGSFLAGALQNLGKPAFDTLLASHRALRADYEAAAREPAFSISEELSKWEQGYRERQKTSNLTARAGKLNSLAETIINSLTTKTIAFDEFVQLLFEIVPGDRHFIFSSLGSLGKDFTEPYDLDWHSDQQNESLIQTVDHKISQYLLDDKASLDVLREAFRHPSETLRLAVFKHCMELAPSHEVASLASEAIAGHLQYNGTQWEGEVALYKLSGRAGGAGQSSVVTPQTLRQLLEHMENHITKHHWNDVVVPLLAVDNSLLRLLGVRLARSVGSAKNFAELEKLLVDEDALIMRAALSCLLEWQPTAVPELLLKSQDSWSADHTREALHCFVRRKNPFKNPTGYLFMRPGSQDFSAQVKTLPPYDLEILEASLRQLPPQTAVKLLDGAAQRLTNDEDAQKTVFSGFPSPADRFLDLYQDKFADELDLLRSWSHHSHPDVRDVGVRWLCILGEFAEERIFAMSKGSTNLERLSCVEAIILTSNETFHEWAQKVIQATTRFNLATSEQSSEELLLPEKAPPYWDYWKRILWALQFSSPAFADMLVPLAKHLDTDIDGLPSAESEELCRRIKLLTLGWGEPGVLPFLELLDEGELDQSVYYYIAVPPLTPHVIEDLRRRIESDEPREFSRRLWDDLNSRSIFADRETLATALEGFVCS